MKSFFTDLRKFLMRGNVIDMAVGVVIGGAFGKIVSSLVADLITPLISLLTGGSSFSELFTVLNPQNFKPTETILTVADIKTRADAAACGLATLNWGNFIQTVIDFLIIGVSVFVALRIIMKAKEKFEKKKEEVPAPPAPPKTDEKILAALEDIKSIMESK